MAAETDTLMVTVGACDVCGCTDDDCYCCYEHTGGPCWWVGPGLCSACAPATAADGQPFCPGGEHLGP